jgi:MFS family permease
VLTAGYIADVVGRRPVFLTGLGVFVIGSLFAGLSTPPLMLIGGRVVQGIGGALLFSTGAVLLAETFRLKPGRAGVAIWGTVTGMAVAVSPLVGGLVTKAFGWRWLFLLNIPVALVAFAIGTVYIKEPSIALTGAVRRSRPGTVPAGEGTKDLADPPDWLGLFLFTAAIAILVIGLVRTSTTSNLGSFTNNGIIALFGCTALLLVAFVAHETQAPAPLLDTSLFRDRTFSGSCVAAFGLSMAVLGPYMFLVLYLSYDLGYSPLGVGARLLLLSGVTVPFLPLTGWLDRYVPAKLLICGGLVLVAAGLWLMSQVTMTSTWDRLVPGLLVAGLGLELVNPRLASAAAATVKPHLAAVAARTSSTFRQLGTATGVAVLGAVFATRLTDDISRAIAASPQIYDKGPAIANLVLEGRVSQAAQVGADGPSDMMTVIHQAFADALHGTFLVAALVALTSAVLALGVRSRDLPRLTVAAGTATATATTATTAPAPGPTSSPFATSSPLEPGEAMPVTPPIPPVNPRGPMPTLGFGAPRQNSEATALPTSAPSAARRLFEYLARVAGGQGVATAAAPFSSNGLHRNGVESVLPAPTLPTRPRDLPHLIDLSTRHRVKGQVTANTGEPLAGATVTLVGPGGERAGLVVAGEDGSFAVDDLGEGTYTLVAMAPHFRVASSIVALRADEAEASVKLLGVGSLAGKVTREKDGAPVQADLELYNPEGVLVLRCQTDVDGAFIVPDVLEGAYELAVHHGAHRSQTVPVDVRRGGTTTTKVSLTGVGYVYGAVSSARGAWMPDVPVTLADSGGEIVASTKTDGAGSFQFPEVAEGHYMIKAAVTTAAASIVHIDAGKAVATDLTLEAG